jgi:hypothetical protein
MYYFRCYRTLKHPDQQPAERPHADQHIYGLPTYRSRLVEHVVERKFTRWEARMEIPDKRVYITVSS